MSERRFEAVDATDVPKSETATRGFSPMRVPDELKAKKFETTVRGDTVASPESYHEQLRSEFSDLLTESIDNNFETSHAKLCEDNPDAIKQFIEGHMAIASWKDPYLYENSDSKEAPSDFTAPGTAYKFMKYVIERKILRQYAGFTKFISMSDYSFNRKPEFEDMSGKDVVEAIAQSVGYLNRKLRDNNLLSLSDYNDKKSKGTVFARI